MFYIFQLLPILRNPLPFCGIDDFRSTLNSWTAYALAKVSFRSGSDGWLGGEMLLRRQVLFIFFSMETVKVSQSSYHQRATEKNAQLCIVAFCDVRGDCTYLPRATNEQKLNLRIPPDMTCRRPHLSNSRSTTWREIASKTRSNLFAAFYAITKRFSKVDKPGYCCI